VSFTDIDLARLLVALAVLLMAAHGMGSLFSRFGQPPAIGEIVGGIMLGPTALAAICPGIQQWIFPRAGMSAAALGAVYQLGLLRSCSPQARRCAGCFSVTRYARWG
jgi:K+:H+ antiporter